ncbi:helix-turn-helix domain-containing protein [Actinoallomurus acaciae]|uniref:Scr1 family TA system antitoxin-like transcriptional regulator n=1 Tax=Actinoallomurus acaciae TaxID=502577 RepID=A0ABV5YPT8_9ACTN
MVKPPSPTLLTLGRIIRFCRDAAGIRQADLAKTLGYSVGWLSNVETGQLRARRDQVVAIERALGLAESTLTDVYDDLPHDHPVKRFERYEERERQAARILDYEALAVPGLLQTEETTRALLMAGRPADPPDAIENLVARRMARQEVLRRAAPPPLWVILDETVIRRPVGGPKVHSAQLDHLLDMADRPAISIQLIPLATGAHAGLVSTFYIFSFENAPSIAYSEDPAAGHIHERPELVRIFLDTYHALQTSALPSVASLSIIKEVRDEI